MGNTSGSDEGPLERVGERVPRPVLRVGLVIPALNEELALPLVLADLEPLRAPGGPIVRVVVVDNGSTDATGEVAAAAGATVVREELRGYGAACLAGIAELGADVEVVAFLDADRSDYAEDLGAVLAPLLDGSADFCVGSRIGGGGAQVLPPQARFGTRLAVVLMRLLFGARWTDLGPQRAIRREALEGLAMRDTDYGWTVEMQLKAHAAKLRSVEVPVRYRERVGESKISGTLRGTLGAGWKILGWIGVWRIRLLLPWGR